MKSSEPKRKERRKSLNQRLYWAGLRKPLLTPKRLTVKNAVSKVPIVFHGEN